MKNYTKPSLIILMLLFVGINSFAQQQSKQNPFNGLDKSIAPEWAKKADWNRPNIHTIDSMLVMHKKEEKKEKVRNKEMEQENEGFDEDPYEMAYIRWKKEMEPFIQPDGSIKYDSTYYRRIILDAIKKQQKKSKPVPVLPLPNQKTNKTISQKKDLTTNITNNVIESASLNNATATTVVPQGTANWQCLGPIETFGDNNSGLSNWQINMYRLVIAPSNPNVLYAFSETGAIFKSINKGINWISISDGFLPSGRSSIAVDPSNENIVYCYSSGDVIIKSIDGGTTWSAETGFPGTSGTRGTKMLINSVTGRIFTNGSGNVYYSDDSAKTWASASGMISGATIYDLALNPATPSMVYAVGQKSGNNLVVLRSVDNGNTFSQVYGNHATDTMTCTGARMTTTIANPGIGYIVSLGNTYPFILKSIDSGSTWAVSVTSTTGGLGGSNAATGLGMSNGQGYYDLAIVANPNNANQVIVGTTTSYRSTDGGINFSPLGGYNGNFALHPDMQSMVALGNDTYISTDGGINYSTDFFSSTQSWSVRNHGLTAAEFWGFAQGWDQDLVVGGRYHTGNTALFDGYGTGNAMRLGGGESPTGIVFHGRDMTAGFDDIGTKVIPSSLSLPITGATYSNSLWPNEDYYGNFFSSLVIHPNYLNIYYVAKDSLLWKSSNYGNSYIALHNFGNGNKVWRFVMCSNNPNIFYLCAQNGIYKSADGGNTWNKIALPSSVSYAYYNSDIVVNPANDKEVYLCMAQGASNNKVFKSTDGGTSWTNITGTQLIGQGVRYLQFHAGSKGGVYAIVLQAASASSGLVYYRDSTMSDWVPYSNGLPLNTTAREGGIIFYRNSKLRIAGDRGIWETPLYTSNALPVARPSADKFQIGCSTDTVNFFDYSFVNYAGIKRKWSFPNAAWVSSDTALRPRVVYSTAGNFDVTLMVTDSSGNSDTKTVAAMINSQNLCGVVDTIPGNCLKINGSGDIPVLGRVPINSNNFSISFWVKPNGPQGSFSQFISHGSPASGGGGFGIGIQFNGYTANLKLSYFGAYGSSTNFGTNLPLTCDSSKWNFITLTYSPTGVMMYLNGVPAAVSTQSMPIIDLSQSPFTINQDVTNYGQGSSFKGLLDEVKFYNYALSQSEVREKMHLIQSNATQENGLLAYYQFNRYTSASSTTYDVIQGNPVTVSAPNIALSTVPVGTGVVYRNTNVISGAQQSFPGAGLDLYWNANSTAPNGEVVAFHLNNIPDSLPNNQSVIPGYFIINNYGANTTFSVPDSIRFSNLMLSGNNNFTLYKREGTAHLNNWNAFGQPYAQQNSSLTWKAPAGLTSFSQFAIIANSTPLPIRLLSFAANTQKSTIVLNWSNAEEDNTKWFELQRKSGDNNDFSTIATLSSKNNSTSETYQYTDQNVIGGTTYYYRLKILAIDGGLSYSDIKSASLTDANNIVKVYPNPLKGNFLRVDFNATKDMTLNIVLLNTNGINVYTTSQHINTGKNTIGLNLPVLASGAYILKIYTGIGESIDAKIIIE